MNEKPATSPAVTGLFKNWLSLAGAVVALGSLFAFLLLFAIDVFAHDGNPYMGILAYVVAPGFLFLGLFLIAMGAWLRRRHLRKGGAAPPHALTIDLSRARDRKALIGFTIGTIGFLLLTALGSYRTYHYTESVQFCGQACHTPMEPEFTTYQHSPHARVACVDCHVGPGPGGYLTAKLNGVHQLVGVMTDNYERPIKTPIRGMPMSQATCEQCHWPERFAGNVDRTYNYFLMDEENTEFSVRLLLHVGGGDPETGETGGIHWHMNLANKVEYIATDERRMEIPWVRLTEPDGTVTEFRTPEFEGDPAAHEIRTMDCMDCHNRPAHQFKTPNEAVDSALAQGRLDASLPWVKSNVVYSLTQTYETRSQAVEGIRSYLSGQYPDTPGIDGVIAEAQKIHRLNFFPEMKADWRAYPDHISHKDWAGCFRCHDGRHKTTDGQRSIGATDCNSCHTILAQGVGDQLKDLKADGQPFLHIDFEYAEFDCHTCHTGGIQDE